MWLVAGYYSVRRSALEVDLWHQNVTGGQSLRGETGRCLAACFSRLVLGVPASPQSHPLLSGFCPDGSPKVLPGRILLEIRSAELTRKGP